MSGAPVVWTGWPHAPAPLDAVRRARRAGAVTVVDDAGTAVPFGRARFVVEFVRGLWLRTLDLGLGALAGLLAPRRAPAGAATGAPGPGPTVLVVPALPDLSHTFVYREALAVVRQRPDWRVVVLAENPRAPRHPEAEALRAHATFLPRHGVTRRACGVLRWLLRRRGRELFALYRGQPAGSARDLLGKGPLRSPTHPGNAFALADLLRPLRPRTIHVYGSTYAANVAMGAATLLGVPFSISSYVDFDFPYAHKMLAVKATRARFFRVVTAYCAARLCDREELRRVPADRFPVVYLGLDLPAWQQEAEPPGTGVLVSAARLVPKKGLHLVPAALARLGAEGLPCRWRVLGDGPERARIEAACAEHGVADRVEFVGAVDSSAVRSALLAADAAVLPCVVAADGERDGIPNFLCEAMALGVPVVTTPISGIPELVQDGETGFLCRPGNSDALAAALRDLLTDRERTRAVAARGREAVHGRLDVDAKARELIALVESRLTAEPAP